MTIECEHPIHPDEARLLLADAPGVSPASLQLVALDERLVGAARREGFVVLDVVPR